MQCCFIAMGTWTTRFSENSFTRKFFCGISLNILFSFCNVGLKILHLTVDYDDTVYMYINRKKRSLYLFNPFSNFHLVSAHPDTIKKKTFIGFFFKVSFLNLFIQRLCPLRKLFFFFPLREKERRACV